MLKQIPSCYLCGATVGLEMCGECGSLYCVGNNCMQRHKLAENFTISDKNKTIHISRSVCGVKKKMLEDLYAKQDTHS